MIEVDIKKLFGQRLKELRTQNGLTQEKLAELINVGERNLSKIECGKSFVKAETIAKIASSLNIKPKDLFDFAYPDDEEIQKEALINAINEGKVNIGLMYRIYKSIE